jgi:hypothetical protein
MGTQKDLAERYGSVENAFTIIRSTAGVTSEILVVTLFMMYSFIRRGIKQMGGPDGPDAPTLEELEDLIDANNGEITLKIMEAISGGMNREVKTKPPKNKTAAPE